MKIVIRAGGIGTRLWPMSRISNPKQFQKIIGSKTMIRTTYERIAPLVKKPENLFISVNQRFDKHILKEIPELLPENIITETDTRNTGPAMCLEVCFLEKKCDPNEIIASITSDDYISNSKAFRDLLVLAKEFIADNPEYIITPAIRPQYLDTGYTYFKAGKSLQNNGREAIYSVANVVEKPNAEYCQELINSGVYFCHTGIYLWQLKNIINLFKELHPEMYRICGQVVTAMEKKNYKQAKKLYQHLEKISIETAITEKISKVAMSVSNRIGWSDLGKWHIIKRILKKREADNLIRGNVIANNCGNSLIYANAKKRIVAVNDVKDLVIVDTEDALFISSMDNSADVKKIVQTIGEKGMEEYL